MSVHMWPGQAVTPQPGHRAALEDMCFGWTVMDAAGKIYRVLSVDHGSGTCRVHEPGSPSVSRLPRSEEMELVSINGVQLGDLLFLEPGTPVRVLHPSKHAGAVGLVFKGNYRVHVLPPGKKPIIVDMDFLEPLEGDWQLTRV